MQHLNKIKQKVKNKYKYFRNLFKILWLLLLKCIKNMTNKQINYFRNKILKHFMNIKTHTQTFTLIISKSYYIISI